MSAEGQERGWQWGAGGEGLPARRRNRRVPYGRGPALSYGGMQDGAASPASWEGVKMPNCYILLEHRCSGKEWDSLYQSQCCQGTQHGSVKESYMPPLHFQNAFLNVPFSDLLDFTIFFLSSSLRGSKLQWELSNASDYYHERNPRFYGVPSGEDPQFSASCTTGLGIAQTYPRWVSSCGRIINNNMLCFGQALCLE